jgi:hypothetical protein
MTEPSYVPSEPASSVRRGRWLRAITYGLIAEIATILTIVVIVVAYKYLFSRGLSEAAYTTFGEHVGAIVGPVGGTIFTFLLAQRLMPTIASGFVAHGIVVALAAIALSVGGSIAGHQGLPAGYTVASALKIIAGALAGYLYDRSLRRNRTV